jgi:hypothetical protein
VASIRVKKKYKVGDTVWIYGVATGAGYNRLVEGQIIHSTEIPNYVETHYIVAVSNGIEDLLEIRTWGNISQDNQGPIGSFRELLMNRPAEQKMLLQTGMRLPDIEFNPEFKDEQDTEPDQNQD